jgi:hypothetical protein
MISYLYPSVLTGQRRSATVEAIGDVVKSPSNTSPVCLIPISPSGHRGKVADRQLAAAELPAEIRTGRQNMVEQLLRSITTFL